MKKNVYRFRRVATTVIFGIILILTTFYIWNSGQNPANFPQTAPSQRPPETNQILAIEALEKLQIKGRAPKTGYSREQFGGDWKSYGKTCNEREKILARDLKNTVLSDDNCTVKSGTLDDPYTGKTISFERGAKTSSLVQIDHVVAISNAWQTGAQNLSSDQRKQLYNDPLELLAVDGPANNKKSDGDAATWLPPNKSFRCEYVARQIAVKTKYSLWLTEPEAAAMRGVLANCPNEPLPSP